MKSVMITLSALVVFFAAILALPIKPQSIVVPSGGGTFPQAVAGTVNSGGIPCFTSSTQMSSSVALTANTIPKGGGAGACPTNSSLTDNGTTVATTENLSTGNLLSLGSFASFTDSGGNVFLYNGSATIPASSFNTGPFTTADTGFFHSSLNLNAVACETNFGITTLNTGGATTTTGLSCLPANSIIEGVVARVTTTITGTCTGWEFGDGTTAARFTTNNTNLTSGSTAVPLSGTAWTTGIASATTGMYQQSASAITITCATGAPSAGAIRVIVYARTFTNPTS